MPKGVEQARQRRETETELTARSVIVRLTNATELMDGAHPTTVGSLIHLWIIPFMRDCTLRVEFILSQVEGLGAN